MSGQKQVFTNKFIVVFMLMIFSTIVIVPMVWAAPGDFDKFVEQTHKTQNDLVELNKQLGAETQKDLNNAKLRLAMAKTLNQSTKELKETFSNLKSLTEAVSKLHIPYVSMAALALSKTLESTNDKVTKVDDAAEKLEKEAKPIRESIMKVITARDRIVSKISLFNTAVNYGLYPVATSVKRCVAHSKSPLKEQYEETMDVIGATLLPEINALDIAAVETTNKLKRIHAATNDLLLYTDSLELFGKTISKFRDNVKKETDALNKAVDAMHKRVSISFRVLGKNYSESFTIDEVMREFDILVGMIKHKVGKVLWKALEKIGAREYVQDLIDEANQVLNDSAKKIGKSLTDKIDGLDNFIGLPSRIEETLAELKELTQIPDMDFSAPSNANSDLNKEGCGRGETCGASCQEGEAVDLAVVDVSVSSDLMVGVSGQVTVVLKNLSGKIATGAVLKVYADDGFQDKKTGLRLASHEEKKVVFNWTPRASGDEELSVNIFPSTQDEDENNNERIITATVKPAEVDQSVDEVVLPELVEKDVPVTISITFSQKSGEPAAATLKVKADDGFTYKDDSLELKTGESKKVDVKWTPKKLGPAVVKVEIIPISSRPETDESNNLKELSTNVVLCKIDLSVDEIVPPRGDFYVNEKALITVKVKNNGPRDTDGAANVTLTSSVGMDCLQEISLKKGASGETKCEWTPEKEGEVTFDAKIDPDTGAGDLKPEDNQKTRKALVRAAAEMEVVISEMRLPTPIQSGQEVKFYVQLHNKTPRRSVDVELILTADDGYYESQVVTIRPESVIGLDGHWTPKEGGSFTVKAEVRGVTENNTITSESTRSTAAVVFPAMPGEGLSGLPDKAAIQQEISSLLDDLKTSYSTGNQATLAELVSKRFPNYAQFIHSLQEDVFSFRNASLFYRINSLDVASDLSSAVSSVHWEVQFMLPTGKVYRKTAEISMRFVKEGESWTIDGLANNTIFGASLLSSVDLDLLLSGLDVAASGVNVTVTGVVVQNKGNDLAQNFRVGYTYRRSGGQTYTGYSTVSVLRAGGQTTLTFTFSGVAFVPAPGDTLRIEVDPDHNIPELKTSDNINTERFPF